MSQLAAFLFTLYYVAVTTFWLTRVIDALVKKAVMRVLIEPTRSWRHGIVVHFWQIIYTGAAMFGLIVLSTYLGYWWWWLNGLYFLFWLLFLGGSIFRLASPSSYRNAKTQKEFLDLLPRETSK